VGVSIGLSTHLLIDSIVHGILLGEIDGLQYSNLGPAFINDTRTSELANICELSVAYDMCFRGLLLLTTLLVSIVVAGGIQGILNSVDDDRLLVPTSIAAFSIYIAPGIAMGVYWNIHKVEWLLPSAPHHKS